jgi:hypothetical protein
MVIAFEEYEFGWYRTILGKGSVEFDEDAEYPVVDNFNFTRPPIGKARAVRREEDGTITAEFPEELILRSEYPDEGTPVVGFSSYINKIKFADEMRGDKQVIVSGQLRCISRGRYTESATAMAESRKK